MGNKLGLLKILILLLINLSFGGCNNRLEFQVPSKELIDTVVLSAIRDLKLNIYEYTKQETDSLIKTGNWSPPAYLNSTLLEWNLDFDSNKILMSDPSLEDSRYLNFRYINDRLWLQDSLILFDKSDSIFMARQIERLYSDTLNLRTPKRIHYINNKLIHRKPRTSHIILYWQFSKPLFNKSKTSAIVGLSTYNLLQSKYDGGVYLIMSREGNTWAFKTDVDWWH